jgi:hypothetical protein
MWRFPLFMHGRPERRALYGQLQRLRYLELLRGVVELQERYEAARKELQARRHA